MQTGEDIRRSAELIASARAELVERWTTWVTEDPSIPEAGRLSRPELVDHMPYLIDAIVDELEALAGGESGARRIRRSQRAIDMAIQHGRGRADAGYDLRAAMRELGCFRAVLIEVCCEHGLCLEGEAAIATHRVIDSAFAETAVTMQELTHAELAGERNAAKSAEAQKGELLSFAVHEIRNVLSVLAEGARAASAVEDPAGSPVLASVERAALRLRQLVRDIAISPLADAARHREATMGMAATHARPR